MLPAAVMERERVIARMPRQSDDDSSLSGMRHRDLVADNFAVHVSRDDGRCTSAVENIAACSVASHPGDETRERAPSYERGKNVRSLERVVLLFSFPFSYRVTKPSCEIRLLVEAKIHARDANGGLLCCREKREEKRRIPVSVGNDDECRNEFTRRRDTD